MKHDLDNTNLALTDSSITRICYNLLEVCVIEVSLYWFLNNYDFVFWYDVRLIKSVEKEKKMCQAEYVGTLTNCY